MIQVEKHLDLIQINERKSVEQKRKKISSDKQLMHVPPWEPRQTLCIQNAVTR